MDIHTLKKTDIEKFLRRMKRREADVAASGPDLESILKEILIKANEFVPSQAGSILLDDPYTKSENVDAPHQNFLYFIACFGPGSERIVGMGIPSSTGVAGKTYTSGRPYVSRDVASDKNFYGGIDSKLNRRTHSIVCVPIVIGKSVCGVIELLNRKGSGHYTKDELKLLEIFAGYTSTLIQNALDAKRNEELTRRDDLTGLFNDRYFHSQLTHEVRKAKRNKRDISLLFMDLDNFKSVNDTYGHLAGSRTLAEVGALLRDTLEGDDASIVRYGGDEFAVILPGKDRREAAVVAEKVREAVKEAVFLKRRGRPGEQAHNITGIITCSIGICSFFEDEISGRTIDQNKISFIRHADRAMYLAKERGKDCVCLGEKCEEANACARLCEAGAR